MINASKIRVLHISSALTYRGGEQQLILLALALKAHQIEQGFLVPKNSPLLERLVEQGFKVNSYNKRGSISLKASKCMADLIKAGAYNLIHNHDSHAQNICWVAQLVYGNKTLNLHAKRNAFKMSNSWLSKRKYNSKYLKKIICISEASKSATVGTITNLNSIAMIPDGINFNEIHEKKMPLDVLFHNTADTQVIANVGALTDEKDQATFIKCAHFLVSQFPKFNFQFLLVGEGPNEKVLRSLADELDLKSHVHFVGFVDDIYALLNSSDILLHTAKTEGLGTILLQALATKINVVSTRCGGSEDIILDQQTGLLASVGDFKGLAEAVVQIIENDELKQRLRSRGFSFVQNYSIENTALKTIEVYKQILSDR